MVKIRKKTFCTHILDFLELFDFFNRMHVVIAPFVFDRSLCEMLVQVPEKFPCLVVALGIKNVSIKNMKVVSNDIESAT